MKTYRIYLALILLLFCKYSLAFEFSAYGSVSYISGDDHNHNNFAISQVELTAQRDLSEKTYAILDILFDMDQDSLTTEVERLSINRVFSNSLEIGFGRFMQPLGFWNHNFSHGTLSQDTISRPYLINIEHHEKGFLPSHVIGGLIRGETDDWTYSLGIGNTDGVDSSNTASLTGPTTVSPLNSNPPNDELSIIFRGTYALMDSLELGLMVGSHNYSEISEGNIGLVNDGEVLFEEQYIAVDFYYNSDSFYLFGEYYNIKVDDNQTLTGGGFSANNDTYNATAYYVQAGYRIAQNFRIAVRYESLDYDDNATLFQVQSIDKRTESILAVSYLPEDSNIIRFEVKQENPEDSKSETIYALQWYFYLL
ncbi:hypothetical protein [Kaarinaea lacus]